MIAAIELAERDPLVVGLTTILNQQRLDDWFAEHSSVPNPPSPVRVSYLRYKQGTSLTVGLQTRTGPTFGYAVSRDARPKLEKLVRQAPPGTVLAVDLEKLIMVAQPAADRDLPGIRRADTDRLRTLSYKPQRRWVGLADRSGIDSVLRCYRPADARRSLARWPAAELANGFRIPEVLDHDRRLGVISTERLPGVPMRRSTGDDQHGVALRAAGRALARWHQVAAPAPTRAALGTPIHVAEQLIMLLPGRSRQIRQLADRLSGPQTAVDLGWCHGDFSVDQLLISDQQPIAILDWDRSGLGPLAADLANADAAGWPAAGRASTQLPADSAPSGLSERGWRDLLDGYTQLRQLPDDLDRHRARAHFLRAAEPFRRAQPDWTVALAANLDRVEELLR
ncbi:MAG TPA: phosphotransferase [Microlunatus sp.]